MEDHSQAISTVGKIEPSVSRTRAASDKDGAEIVIAYSQRQIQSFLDELKNGTRNYRTVASLSGQITQEYRGRCVLELLQNAHDALASAVPGSPRKITFVLTSGPQPVLLVGNGGLPFFQRDFEGICQLGQSPKDPNKSVGNKGLGFRSVLEVSTKPEIYSSSPDGGGPAFSFRFDPEVTESISSAIFELESNGLGSRSPLDPEQRLVDWSQEQLTQFAERVSDGLDAGQEVRSSLSPYLLPIPASIEDPEVIRLLEGGHSTVIRLPIDGGSSGDVNGAIETIVEQLATLDERAPVFLHDLERLAVVTDGVERVLKRDKVDEHPLSTGSSAVAQKIRITSGNAVGGDSVTTTFRLWSRTFGEKRNEVENLATVVKHLPNRWPELRRVAFDIAVRDGGQSEKGAFVIFLPTEMSTGTGAFINAPFYGSLDRRQINFEDDYNKLLLDCVVDLCLEVTTTLSLGGHDGWRAQAIVDLLSSLGSVGGSVKAWKLFDRIDERAKQSGSPLSERSILLCDKGWCRPSSARVMPIVPEDSPIDSEIWRKHAGFEVVSGELDERVSRVKALIEALGGSSSPEPAEWSVTVENIAGFAERTPDTSWDEFMRSVVKVLPEKLTSSAKNRTQDPLRDTKFLPSQDGRLLSASDGARMFFLPVQMQEETMDQVGHIPPLLLARVAFLHPEIQTLEGQPRRNSAVQKFLEDRFVKAFRREDLLRDVALASVPELPVEHGTQEADLCSAILSWALRLIGKEGMASLASQVGFLPLACQMGWLRARDAVFGPGWPGHLGDLLWEFSNSLPEPVAERLQGPALLPQDDERWGAGISLTDEILGHAGVRDGFHLIAADDIDFTMDGRGQHELPENAPSGIPQSAWDEWRDVYRAKARPYYEGSFPYRISGIWLLPELHRLKDLPNEAVKAFSRLLLASMLHWGSGWEIVRIRKTHGNAWSCELPSPLCFWLSKIPWLGDSIGSGRSITARWLVPESLILGQKDRFAHLDPIPIKVAREIQGDPKLEKTLGIVGLKRYPVEQEKTGPELLEALASAWVEQRVPPGRFDVFLGQVRDAWRHLASDAKIPGRMIVRTGNRAFRVFGAGELAGVYLPDSRDRVRSLFEQAKPVLEMQPSDANRFAEKLMASTSLRRASDLDERILIDGQLLEDEGSLGELLDESRLSWLPVVLLTLAAHGGSRPVGATTRAWQDAAGTLRRARVFECDSIVVQLLDGDQTVAAREPHAQWIEGDVLAVRRDVELEFDHLATAAQAMLGRQDLLKDLRLVLGFLAQSAHPTLEQIEAALDRAEIDVQAIADIQHRWSGAVSTIVDRIRPVLALLEISSSGLESAAIDIEHLKEWLENNIRAWEGEELLSSAKRSRDDRSMGLEAWRALGEIAQLPAWNRTLSELGERYVQVENRASEMQAANHLEAAARPLQGFARFIALAEDLPDRFLAIDEVRRTFVVPGEWSRLWWEVPFSSVMDALFEVYLENGVDEKWVALLRGAESVEEMQESCEAQGIVMDPDPYELAATNEHRLQEGISTVRNLCDAWAIVKGFELPRLPREGTGSRIDPDGYLKEWSAEEILQKALAVVGCGEFTEACAGLLSIDEIRDHLGIEANVLEKCRSERDKAEREAERKRRTIDVAGEPFEVGKSSYEGLFARLDGTEVPLGPDPKCDEFPDLRSVPPGGGKGGGGGGGKKSKSSHRRLSPELRELVGITGEIHAYRFLRRSFGGNSVRRDSWVSESRLKVLPLVEGEEDPTSDGLGYDFKFRHQGEVWHVEVKASSGDDTEFELGISEIEAASRMAATKKGRWRILRVREALSDQPLYEWLPNPFEENYQGFFRLQKGGMHVRYSRAATKE